MLIALRAPYDGTAVSSHFGAPFGTNADGTLARLAHNQRLTICLTVVVTAITTIMVHSHYSPRFPLFWGYMKYNTQIQYNSDKTQEHREKHRI